MTGRILRHVAHMGRGFPSDPRGISGFAGMSLRTSDATPLVVRRGRSIRGSSSFGLRFSVVLRLSDRLGVEDARLEAFCFPLPLLGVMDIEVRVICRDEEVEIESSGMAEEADARAAASA